MPIQRKRIYTDFEVDGMVRASERRLSQASHARDKTGHTGELHVLITNVELADRAQGFKKDMPLACAFAGTPEAIRAVTEALNSTEGQAALQYLDDNYPTGIRACLEATVSTLVVRYSSGMDVVRKTSVTNVLVLLERIEEQVYHGLHVHTAYPILYFRRGRPAWMDNNKQWH